MVLTDRDKDFLITACSVGLVTYEALLLSGLFNKAQSISRRFQLLVKHGFLKPEVEEYGRVKIFRPTKKCADYLGVKLSKPLKYVEHDLMLCSAVFRLPQADYAEKEWIICDGKFRCDYYYVKDDTHMIIEVVYAQDFTRLKTKLREMKKWFEENNEHYEIYVITKKPDKWNREVKGTDLEDVEALSPDERIGNGQDSYNTVDTSMA